MIKNTLLILCAFLASYLTFEVIPERHQMIYINEKYVKNVNVSVRRAGKNAKYVLNIEAVLLHRWEKNITFQFAFFEYRQNQYKPSFVDIPEMNFCDSVNFFLFRKTLEKFLWCPMPAGAVHLTNLTLAIDDFPYKWPFERCKARFTIRTIEKVLILIGDLYMTLKQNTPVKKPK